MANHQMSMCETKHHDARVADLPGKERGFVVLDLEFVLISDEVQRGTTEDLTTSNPDQPPLWFEGAAVWPCWLLSRKCESVKEGAFDVETAPSITGFLPVPTPFFPLFQCPTPSLFSGEVDGTSTGSLIRSQLGGDCGYFRWW